MHNAAFSSGEGPLPTVGAEQRLWGRDERLLVSRKTGLGGSRVQERERTTSRPPAASSVPMDSQTWAQPLSEGEGRGMKGGEETCAKSTLESDRSLYPHLN